MDVVPRHIATTLGSRRTLRTALLVLLGSLLFVGCSVTLTCGTSSNEQGVDDADSDDGRYENAALHFAFDHPTDWEPVDEPLSSETETGNPPVATVAFGSLAEENRELNGLVVTVFRLDRTIRSDQVLDVLGFYDNFLAQGVARAGGAITVNEVGALAGQPAKHYEAGFLYGGETPTRIETIVTIKDDLEFEVTCQASEDLFESVHDGCSVVFDSFSFTN